MNIMTNRICVAQLLFVIEIVNALPAILIDGARGYTQIYYPQNRSASLYNLNFKLPHYGGGVAVVLNGNAYFIGGAYQKTLNIVNLTSYETTVGPSLSIGRSAHEATVVNNTIIVCGGLDNPKSGIDICINSCEQFDLQTNVWKSISSLPINVSAFAMVTLNKRVYTFGGYSCMSGDNCAENLNNVLVSYFQKFCNISITKHINRYTCTMVKSGHK
jgi:N-acetylneuraminic acid mutarotase